MGAFVSLKPKFRFIVFQENATGILHLADEDAAKAAIARLQLTGFSAMCSVTGTLSYVARQSWPDDVICADCWKAYEARTK